MRIYFSNSKDQLSNHLAKEVIAPLSLRSFERKEDRFSVAVSGGSLPKLLSSGLVKTLKEENNDNFAKSLENWSWFYADERIVPLNHEDSNHNLASSSIYEPIAKIYKQIVSTNHQTLPWKIFPIEEKFAKEKDWESCASSYAAVLAHEFGIQNDDIPEFDLILLGMGPDGHTCSLFPEHALLSEKGKSIAYLTDSPKPPPQRITITLPVLEKAKLVVLFVTGSGKAGIIKRVMENASNLLTDGRIDDSSLLPVERVLAIRKNKDIYWYLDEDALEKCPKILDNSFDTCSNKISIGRLNK